ncbi:MAG TPA: DUF899 family protein [Candidatus Methylomirabilis sp.]|nr:DUF899 family protein [Gemmatimonadaceae bacterium]HYB43483.1 DUF899 family protein [Candidatus Methylomirabilis sp.]
MSTTLHAIRFPGESTAYRSARDDLLEAEIALRRHIEQVAALRRRLPLGGAVAKDYVFDEAKDPNDAAGSRPVRLAELFRPGLDTLALYSFMYGPKMKQACPMCTSMLDGLNASAPHIEQRVNLAVAAKSPLPRIREHAASRGWRNLRLLSSAGNSYTLDYHGEDAAGNQLAMMNIFVRRDGTIYHQWATELFFTGGEPGMDARHVDMLWPVWNLFDLTPEGRGTDWYPRLRYDPR